MTENDVKSQEKNVESFLLITDLVKSFMQAKWQTFSNVWREKIGTPFTYASQMFLIGGQG